MALTRLDELRKLHLRQLHPTPPQAVPQLLDRELPGARRVQIPEYLAEALNLVLVEMLHERLSATQKIGHTSRPHTVRWKSTAVEARAQSSSTACHHHDRVAQSQGLAQSTGVYWERGCDVP